MFTVNGEMSVLTISDSICVTLLTSLREGFVHCYGIGRLSFRYRLFVGVVIVYEAAEEPMFYKLTSLTGLQACLPRYVLPSNLVIIYHTKYQRYLDNAWNFSNFTS